MSLTYKNKNYFKKIITLSIISLIIGHMSLRIYFSNYFINSFSIATILLIMYFQFVTNREVFGFILVIFICSMFRFGVSNGGLFNIIGFFIAPLLYLSRRNNDDPKMQNNPLNFFIIIFILSNIFGWAIKNTMPTRDMIYGIISLFGMIFIFIITSKVEITKERLNLFIRVLVVISIYMFFVNINQEFNIFKTRTPLLWGSDIQSRHSFSTFGDSELFGEYGLLTFVFLYPLLLSKLTKYDLNLNENIVTLGLIISLLHIIMSGSRSVVLILVFILTIFSLFSHLSGTRVINKHFNIFPYAILALPLIIILNMFFKYDYILSRFSKINFTKMNIENVITGQEINRKYAFSFALDRISSETWFVGYGWGTTKSNGKAWFKNPLIRKLRADYHSLYLSLPMLFGWFGATSFVMIILNILYNLIKIIIKNKFNYNYIVLVTFSLILLIISFLFNQYKINSMRWPQYFMLVWVWLGLANAVINTYKQSSSNRLEY
ncbi:hypothetical protein D1BOALGB6SA_5724 [Olavius sp. associated proteobacterium Delta 1]|nr:hypothetical protein D1BOALGB6SA_5724 [Olavius sp. associated proteobacterium Delta 1]